MFKTVLLAFALLLTVPATHAQRPAPAADLQRLSALEVEILRLVNEHRATLSLPALAPDSVLSALARKHSEQMASGKVPFEHVGFDGRKKAYKKARNLAFVGAFAENIAEGSMDAREVLELWLTSEGHKRNIEGPFGYIGIGVARSRNGDLYFTQLFARAP